MTSQGVSAGVSSGVSSGRSAPELDRLDGRLDELGAKASRDHTTRSSYVLQLLIHVLQVKRFWIE